MHISPRKIGLLVTHFHSKIVFDSNTKFMAEFAKMCQNYYGLKIKPKIYINPQSNVIIKRIHQTIENIIHTFDMSNIVNNDPWSVILASTMFAVRATYHTTLQAHPMKIVFGRDAILKIKHAADWEHIRQHKQLRINRNKNAKICDGITTNTRKVTKL